MTARRRVYGMIFGVILFAFSLHAQETDRNSKQKPDDDSGGGDLFSPLLASPTEPASFLRYAGDSQMDFGLSEPFAFYTLEGKQSSWQVGMRPGIAARFESRNTQLLLKAADFRLGIPLAYRKGKWSARVELFHLSSHRGADFVTANQGPAFSYSRETVQTVVAYGPPGNWRVYTGSSLVLRTRPSVGRWAFEAGTEWFPRAFSRPHFRFYLAEDIESREEAHWNANLSVEPGLLLTTSQGRPVARLAGWFYRGQMPFGQFFQEQETRAGVQLVLELRPSLKSLRTRRK